MTREDYGAFAKALGRTAETFRESLSLDRIDSFFDALSDLSLAQVVSALRLIEQRSEWFPRGPAIVRSAVDGTVDDAAERAWQRFRWALQHVTIYDDVDFQDPVLVATVMSMFGGWTQTAEIQSARMGQIRQDFLKTYATCVRAGMQNAPSYRVALPGTQSNQIYDAEQTARLHGEVYVHRAITTPRTIVVPLIAAPTALVPVVDRVFLDEDETPRSSEPILMKALEPWPKKNFPTT